MSGIQRQAGGVAATTTPQDNDWPELPKLFTAMARVSPAEAAASQAALDRWYYELRQSLNRKLEAVRVISENRTPTA